MGLYPIPLLVLTLTWGYVLYPLDDARTMTKIKDLIQRSMNKDGSLKHSLKKHVVSCLNKTLYLCKK